MMNSGFYEYLRSVGTGHILGRINCINGVKINLDMGGLPCNVFMLSMPLFCSLYLCLLLCKFVILSEL